MGLKKGQTNNPNGRPKGRPNKTTKDLRDWINKFIDRNTAQIEEDWKVLEPKDRLMIFEKLLKYTLPALQSTTLTTDIERLSDEQLDKVISELKNTVNDTPGEN
jgi:hypothetical protein